MNKILVNKNLSGQNTFHIICQTGEESFTSFPIQADNPHWIALKKQILADEAQLQDAEGDTMSAAEAKAYVATLP